MCCEYVGPGERTAKTMDCCIYSYFLKLSLVKFCFLYFFATTFVVKQSCVLFILFTVKQSFDRLFSKSEASGWF